jgi:P-type Cu+ transporter
MTECYHCGTECTSLEISCEEYIFCCLGCKNVYQLLKSSNLDHYYKLNDNPGSAPIKGNYLHLDNLDIQEKICDFKLENQAQISLNIPSIHCISCVWLLERLNKFDENIISSRINFSSKTCSIRYNPKDTNPSTIAQLLSDLGYTPEVEIEKPKNQGSINKTELLRLVVAGVCFGNVMLFSFPAYFGLNAEEFQYFQYLNFLFSLPIVFFCAAPYSKSLFSFYKTRHFNLDFPIIIGIIALFTRSCYDLYLGAHGYWDSLTGLVFFLLLGKTFQDKSIKQLHFDRDYKSFFPFWARKINPVNKDHHVILADKISVNDLLLIKNEEIIPCDGILISDNAQLDYSFVSGESELVNANKNDTIFAGAKLVGKAIEFKATKIVNRSYLTSLWSDIQVSEHNNSLMITSLSKFFTPLVLFTAVCSALFSDEPFITFTAVTIIACPCALALSYPLTLGFATRSLAEVGLYLKNIYILEKLSKIDTMIFDKTGTITTNDCNIWQYQGISLSENDNNYIKSLCLQSTHPISSSLTQSISGQLLDIDDYNEKQGQGIQANINGNNIAIGSPKWLGDKSTLSTSNNRVSYSINGNIKGTFYNAEKPREGVIAMLKRLNLKKIMCSGDTTGNRPYLSNTFENKNIFYEHKPIDKLNLIHTLNKKNTAMLGDGLNDAGALAESDVGIAVVEDKNSFFPASDALLQSKALKNLDKFLLFSKNTTKVVRYAFIFSLFYNIVGVSLAIVGILTPLISAILMPISSVSILLTAYGGIYYFKNKNLRGVELCQ